MSNTPITLKSLLGLKNIQLSTLATKLNVNKSSVTRWAKNKVPGERVLEVEAATGIPRDLLRPDLYGTLPTKKAKRKSREAAE